MFNYQLHEKCNVSIIIYDIAGRKVRVMVDKYQPAGYYSLKWDGTDDLGNGVASGIYMLHMRAGGFSKMRKMTLMR